MARMHRHKVTIERQWRVAVRAMMGGATPWAAMRESGMRRSTFYGRLGKLKGRMDLVVGE